MQKILFAIREEIVEDAISKIHKNEYQICGSVTYREGIISNIHHLHPDIILFSETLPGSVSIDSIIYEIRVRFQNVRVIMLAGKHDPGDDFLSSLIARGVYDIILGGNTTIDAIINKIRVPATYADVVHLQDRDISNASSENKEQMNYVVAVPESQIPAKKGLFSKLRKNKQEITTLSQLDEATIRRLSNVHVPAENIQPYYNGERTVQNAFIQNGSMINATQSQPPIQCTADLIAMDSRQVDPGATSRLACYDMYREEDKRGVVFEKNTNNVVFSGSIEPAKQYNQTIYELPPVLPKPIITVFGGSRIGVGTTSSVINTAQALAALGKRVLVIDGCPGYNSKLFKYLGLENTELGFDKALEGYMQGFSTNPNYFCYSRDSHRTFSEEEQYRRNLILNYIDYMRYSESFSWRKNDERLAFIGNYLDSLRGYYDHILIDTCFDSPDYFTQQFIVVADSLVYVTTQDAFVIEEFQTCNCAKYISQFTGKKIALTNFYSSSLAYDINISEKLRVNFNIDVPVDITGYVAASYSKIPYYYDVASKCKESFVVLAKLLL